MPVLNPEVLIDVLIQCLKKDYDSRNLGKYMFSGREPLHAALNYFKKAKTVEIYSDCMDVTVVYGGLTRKHEISYQFSMINLIMKTIALKLDELIITGLPRYLKAIEYFLDQKIKKVQVRTYIPQKFQQIIASCDFIEKITFGKPYSWDIIPDSCRTLKLKFSSFGGMYEFLKYSKEYIKNIEHLEIEPIGNWSKSDISTLCLDHFPRLKSIDVLAAYEDNIKFVIGMFKDKKLNFLQKFAYSNLTGKLLFKNRVPPDTRKSIPSFEQVLQDVRDIPGVTADEENQTITRTVELKENLVAEFILVFSIDYDYYEQKLNY